MRQKVRILQEDMEKKAVALLQQEGRSIESYLMKELNVLLGWHQVRSPPGVNSKKDVMLAVWWQIKALGKRPPPYTRWTEEEEDQGVALSGDTIDIGDSMDRRKLVLRQRKFKAAAVKMSQESRDELRWKFDELDAEEALVSLAETSSSLQEVTGAVKC
jgi:hypothetical protein